MAKRKRTRAVEPPPQRTVWRIPSASGWTWTGIVALAALTAAVYLPALGGGELLDDDLLLTKNKIVQSSDGLYRFWFTAQASDYWPVTNTTFWIEWHLWGERLTGYHVTNLALHIAESLLIWLLLRRLGIPGDFWGALLFAVHPVNVESVAWIASRKNLVAMLFFLLSLWCYLNAEEQSTAEKSRSTKDERGERASVWARATAFSSEELTGVWYWLSLAAFLLAMLGKGSVAVMPALLLCVLWWKRPLEWRDARPYDAVPCRWRRMAAVNVWFQTHDTEKIIRNVGFIDRSARGRRRVWFYLYKAIWPFDLASSTQAGTLTRRTGSGGCRFAERFLPLAGS